jgi:hypothetical protein
MPKQPRIIKVERGERMVKLVMVVVITMVGMVRMVVRRAKTTRIVEDHWNVKYKCVVMQGMFLI